MSRTPQKPSVQISRGCSFVIDWWKEFVFQGPRPCFFFLWNSLTFGKGTQSVNGDVHNCSRLSQTLEKNSLQNTSTNFSFATLDFLINRSDFAPPPCPLACFIRHTQPHTHTHTLLVTLTAATLGSKNNGKMNVTVTTQVAPSLQRRGATKNCLATHSWLFIHAFCLSNLYWTGQLANLSRGFWNFVNTIQCSGGVCVFMHRFGAHPCYQVLAIAMKEHRWCTLVRMVEIYVCAQVIGCWHQQHCGDNSLKTHLSCCWLPDRFPPRWNCSWVGGGGLCPCRFLFASITHGIPVQVQTRAWNDNPLGICLFLAGYVESQGDPQGCTADQIQFFEVSENWKREFFRDVLCACVGLGCQNTRCSQSFNNSVNRKFRRFSPKQTMLPQAVPKTTMEWQNCCCPVNTKMRFRKRLKRKCVTEVHQTCNFLVLLLVDQRTKREFRSNRWFSHFRAMRQFLPRFPSSANKQKISVTNASCLWLFKDLPFRVSREVLNWCLLLCAASAWSISGTKFGWWES